MRRHKKSWLLILLVLTTGILFVFVLFFVFEPAFSDAPTQQSYIITDNQQPTVPVRMVEEAINKVPTVTPHQYLIATFTPQPLYSTDDLSMANILPTALPPTSEELIGDSSTPTLVPLLDNPQLDQYTTNPFTIGYSVNNLPLEMYRFGSGTSARLIIAGIHGGYEYNTTNLANEMIAFLISNPQIIPDDVTLYILPTLNPDGLQKSHGYAGRANMNNVDLNRNWDHNWAAEWDTNGCWQYLPITGGNHPLSEPETVALNDFILSHPLDAVISYHSAGLGIFAGGAPDSTISEPLAEALAAVAPYPYPPVFTVCEFTGQFTDYLSTINIPAVDIELTNHKDSDFDLNIPILIEFLQWSPPSD